MSIQPKYEILSPEQEAIADELLKEMSTYQPNRQELHGLTLPMPLRRVFIDDISNTSVFFLPKRFIFFFGVVKLRH